MTQDHIDTFIEQCKSECQDYIVGVPVGNGQWRIAYSASSLGSAEKNLSPEDDLLVMLSTVLTNDKP